MSDVNRYTNHLTGFKSFARKSGRVCTATSHLAQVILTDQVINGYERLAANQLLGFHDEGVKRHQALGQHNF